MSEFYNSVMFNFLQGSDISGQSSWDIYKELNPEATKQDFLNLLKGKSAYELWLQLEGNEGKTEQDYFDYISGRNNNFDSFTVVDTSGFMGSEGEAVNAQTMIDNITTKIDELLYAAEELSNL